MLKYSRIEFILSKYVIRSTELFVSDNKTRLLCKLFSSSPNAYKKSTSDDLPLPDAVSNIRRIKVTHPINATPLQQKYLNLQQETQEWHQRFWTQHNQNFQKEKQAFVSKIAKAQTAENQHESIVDPAVMATFYRKFLNDNCDAHSQYNRQWYRANGYLLWLSLLVQLEKFMLFFRRQKS